MWIENAQIKVSISYVENITTHVVHLDTKNHKGKPEDFELLQINDGQIEFRVPRNACVLGHQLDIEIVATSDSDSWPLKSRAKVTHLEKLTDELFDEIVVDLHNKQDIDYQRFYELFEQRQKQVENLFKKVKGYE
ncbi:MAG: hypothetical protein KDD34_02450 [Bdellovibrionales bacterium]|nr:hypothetical protein [Bdellovibrionales bacterium]